jgi:hypothetical protein
MKRKGGLLDQFWGYDGFYCAAHCHALSEADLRVLMKDFGNESLHVGCQENWIYAIANATRGSAVVNTASSVQPSIEKFSSCCEPPSAW